MTTLVNWNANWTEEEKYAAWSRYAEHFDRVGDGSSILPYVAWCEAWEDDLV